MAILIVLALIVRLRLKETPAPKSLQNFFESLIETFFNFINSITRSPSLTKRLFPLIFTFFIFIISENLLGMIPGFLGTFYVKFDGKIVPLLKSPNSDLNSTVALALISVFSIQYFAIREMGFKKYLKRFFNFSNPLKLIVGLFELISEINKILSLSLRLFGNILAGEVLLLVIAFLVPYFLPLPFMILELFVGAIQAFIFSTLSLVFIRSAQMEYT
jgi:F-type H+-transporting ATPase subunit a